MGSENITFRTQQARSSSLNDLSASSLFEATMLSLPNNSFDGNKAIKELHDQIKKISDELVLANQKIHELKLENNDIKIELKTCKKVMNNYSKNNSLCESPMSVNYRKRKRQRIYDIKRIVDTPLSSDNEIELSIPMSHDDKQAKDIEAEQAEILEIEENIKIGEEPVEGVTGRDVEQEEKDDYMIEKDHNNSKPNINVDEVSSKKGNLGDSKSKAQLNYVDKEPLVLKAKSIGNVCKGDGSLKERKKIIILADQQGRGLQKILQKQIGSDFEVTCFWKSGAHISKILEAENSEISKLKKTDYVVILGGINDNSPYEFQIMLTGFCNKYNNTNILVSEIPFSKYLNESKINYIIRFICKNCKNVNFMDLDYMRYRPGRNEFTANICKIILRYVLHFDYKYRIQLNRTQVTSTKHINTRDTYTQTDCLTGEDQHVVTNLDKYTQTDHLAVEEQQDDNRNENPSVNNSTVTNNSFRN